MNEALSLSAAGLSFIAAHEGFRAAVYRDAAGLETIGYGHRLVEGERFPNGIAEDAARRLLAADAARADDRHSDGRDAADGSKSRRSHKGIAMNEAMSFNAAGLDK